MAAYLLGKSPMTNWPRHHILLASCALLLTACDWIEKKSTSAASADDRAGHNRIVFWRPNTAGGSDLLTTTIDGLSPLANLTDHTLDQVDLTHAPVYIAGKNRAIYAAGRAGVLNLFTVQAAQDGRTPTQQLTSFGLGEINDFAVVGDYVVVDATVDGIQNLWSAPIDGSQELRRLSGNLIATARIRWHPGFHVGQRWIYFEYSTTHLNASTTAVFSADLTARTLARPISIAQDLVTICTTDNPLASDGTTKTETAIRRGEQVLLRAQDRTGSVIQYELADIAGAVSRPLTRAFSTAIETVRSPLLVGDRLVFVLENLVAGSANLRSVPIAGTRSELELTNFAGQPDAPQDIDYALTPMGTMIVGVATQADATTPGNHFAEIFSVRAETADSFALLTDRTAYAQTLLGADDIDLSRAIVIGEVVVFGRASFPDRVFQAVLGEVHSETTVFGAGETRPYVLIEEVVRETIAGVPLWQRPVIAGFTTTTTELGSESFSNLTALRQGGRRLVTLPLSDQRITPGPIVARGAKGERIVYTRGGAIYSADYGRPSSELPLTAGTTTLTAAHVFPAVEGGDRIFFEANGQLFSTPFRVPVESGQVRLLSSLLPTVQSIQAVHFASSSRVVFSVATGGTVTVASSPLAPAMPASTDVSRAISTADVFVFSL